jgi:hypothetical protein
VDRWFQIGGETKQVGPGNVLRLIEQRRDEGEAPIRLFTESSHDDEIGNGGDGLASPAMSDHDGPALVTTMKW